MSLRGLERLVTNLPGATEMVDIESELLAYRRFNSDRPLIVVNLFSLHNLLSHEERLWICGGDTEYATRVIMQAFQRFEKLKPHFVFFASLYTSDDEAETWCQKSDVKYKNRLGIMEMIYKEATLEEIVQTYRKGKMHNDFVWLIIPIIKSIAIKYGEIIYVSDIASAMAKYANEHKALAVLGSVSDFLVTPGDWKIWNAGRLRRDMSCVAFHRQKLQAVLKLKPEQMPAFGALYAAKMAENVSLTADMEMVVGLAEVVRKMPSAVACGEEDWLTVAEELFENPEESWHCLVKQYNEYKPEPFVHVLPSLDPFMQKIHRSNDPIVFQILQRKFTFSTLSYIDLSKEDMPNIAELLMKLRRKEMGIISSTNREEKTNYTLVMKIAHDEPFALYEVEPIYPKVRVPSIHELLFHSEDRNYELESQKYALIAWCISESLNDRKMITISKEFLLTSLTLLYMVEQKCIEPKEADVFLSTIYQLKMGFRERVPAPETLNERAFRLCFIYLKFYEEFRRLFDIVGLQHLTVDLTFNGYLLHRNYTKMMNTEKTEAHERLANVPHYLRLY